MSREKDVRLLRGRLPAFGGARNPHEVGYAPRLPVLTMIALLLSVLVVSGCGFQLRGAANLPKEMSTTWVKVPDPTSAFARELELLLRGNGVTLADSPGDGVAELRILRERITRRALTISGDARVREFELEFDLQFSLVDASGDILLGPESLRLKRDFRFDEQEILGATTEEELLREDLRRSMAATLIRRLEAFGRS